MPNILTAEDENKTSDFINRHVVAINANARSLAPKMESLADCMSELEADYAIVTETWLQDRMLENAVIDAAGGHGLDSFTLNRQKVASNGRQYGGVAIFSRSSSTNLRKVEIRNPDNYEVLCVAGKISKLKEKAVIIAVYIPPNYPRHRAEACLDYVADVVSEARRLFESACITVAGDWNQWPVKHILDEHQDLVEVEHGPTRGDRKIDSEFRACYL